jgi:hypothetical protein
VDPFGKPLLGGEPVEQRDELLALGGLAWTDSHPAGPACSPSSSGSVASSLQRRAATLYGINLLLLLSVVWAMEFKPVL